MLGFGFAHHPPAAGQEDLTKTGSRPLIHKRKTRHGTHDRYHRGVREPTRNPEITPLDHDLSGLLREWPFDQERLNVRFLELEGDRIVVQVRVELGVLQMERDGRPDGAEDLLAAVEARIAEDPELRIDPQTAADLRAEAVQVHQRYVALLSLEAYDLVVRDTARNLRVFDLCRDRAVEDSDRTVLEQFRPQVVATRARAEALGCLREDRVGDARRVLDAAIAELRDAIPEGGEEPQEIPMLEGMRDVLQPQLPTSQRYELERRLQAALTAENYELAAILRDELRQLP